MIDIHDLLDAIGLTLLTAYVAVSSPGLGKVRLPRLGVIAAVAGTMIWLPVFHGNPLAYYLRGLVIGFSLPTIVIIVLGLARTFGWHNGYTTPLSRELALVIVLLLGSLYASTLGYIRQDLYGAGYQPQALLAGTALLLALAWWRSPGLALAWLAGLTAFACLGSGCNLWTRLATRCFFVLLAIDLPSRENLPALPCAVCQSTRAASSGRRDKIAF